MICYIDFFLPPILRSSLSKNNMILTTSVKFRHQTYQILLLVPFSFHPPVVLGQVHIEVTHGFASLEILWTPIASSKGWPQGGIHQFMTQWMIWTCVMRLNYPRDMVRGKDNANIWHPSANCSICCLSITLIGSTREMGMQHTTGNQTGNHTQVWRE